MTLSGALLFGFSLWFGVILGEWYCVAKIQLRGQNSAAWPKLKKRGQN
jgi:hypothetical protein